MPTDWRDSLRSMLPADYAPEPETAEDAPTQKPWPKLTVALDRKRAGKTASIISGFEPDAPRCAELAAELKRKFACGGSSRGGEILIQGDRVQQIKEYLRGLGIKV